MGSSSSTRRRAARLAAAAAAAGVAYAASGAGGRSLRVPLGLLTLAAVGNLGAQLRVAAKATAVEQRLNNHITATAPAVSLVANGGTIGGSLTVSGDHTVSGDINGGGHVQAPGNISNAIGGGTGNMNTNGTFNGGNANLPGGLTAGANIFTSADISASGNVSDGHATNIGNSVASLPGFIFSASKAALVSAIGIGHTTDQVEAMCAAVIHSLKNADLMSS